MVGIDQISRLTDPELLTFLCSTSEDVPLFAEFVKRFLPDIKEECIQICKKRKLDHHVGIQIAHETLERVRKYKTFNTHEIKGPDTRKGILVYLFRISTSLFNDHYKREKKIKDVTIHKTYLEDLFDPEEANIERKRLKDIKDIALQVLSKLNEKERKVVIADIEYKKFQKYLPDDINERLAAELGVKKDTIRKIRERAITKLKTAIDEINQQ